MASDDTGPRDGGLPGQLSNAEADRLMDGLRQARQRGMTEGTSPSYGGTTRTRATCSKPSKCC